MNRKHLICILAALLVAAPLLAVFHEKNLGQTLHVLRFELQQDSQKMVGTESTLSDRHERVHFDMVNTMKRCNELSLMLYSQKQDFTFDMTYALKSVTQEYDRFNAAKFPYEQIIDRIDVELDRYSRLVAALKRLPPQIADVPDLPDSLEYRNDSIDSVLPAVYSDKIVLSAVRELESDAFDGEFMSHHHDSDEDDHDGHDHEVVFELDAQGRADRDSCIVYATSLLKYYSATRTHVLEDNENYEDTSRRLKESYDYAQDRYRSLQKRMFVRGQSSILDLLLNFGSTWKGVMLDISNKYGTRLDSSISVDSGWKGPKLLKLMLMEIFLALLSLAVALLLRRHLLRRVRVKGLRDILDKAAHCSVASVACGIFCIIVFILMLTFGRGFFKVASELLAMYAALSFVMMTSVIIRLAPEKTSDAMKLYLPMMMVAFLVMVFRVTFIPNSLMNLVFPLALLVFFIWQLRMNVKYQDSVQTSERIIVWSALVVNGGALVLSCIGYGFIAVVAVLWWFFQAALVETLLAFRKLMIHYRDKRMAPRLQDYKKTMRFKTLADTAGGTLSVTWFYNFCSITLLPVLAILSVPLCLQLALNVFDFREFCHTIFTTPFFDIHDASGEAILHLSVLKIIVAASVYYLFRYFNFITHAVYERICFTNYMNKSGIDYVHKNEINLSLGNSLISMLIWFIYIVIVINLLKIPTGAVTVIATGLSAGIGLALKDVLNNFIYGIQLMSGRLRVGDWVECDGVRGKVSAISYQSTQIETTDGAVMSFLNMSLFNKNFKNLTRNNSYELVKIVVGVSYGTDVNKVRCLLMDAFAAIQTKDAHGREIVDKVKGVKVQLDDLGESSVDIAIKQFVLVSEKAGYVAKAKELIYNTLNENGIEIPFPQRDIHIKSGPVTD